VSTSPSNCSIPGIGRPLMSSVRQNPFWVKKQMLAMWCWAMSATGIARSEPGSFAIQVLWPSS